jgi:hypothetical protein
MHEDPVAGAAGAAGAAARRRIVNTIMFYSFRGEQFLHV